MKFVGRNQLDGATLDRFVFVFWEYDEDFEVHVAGEDQREWTFHVQKCRKAAASCGVSENVVFATPRAHNSIANSRISPLRSRLVGSFPRSCRRSPSGRPNESV